MRFYILIFLILIFPPSILCQGRFQRLYDGALVYSTGSSFLVVNVTNINTKESKQILCDVNELMTSVIIEENGKFGDPLIVNNLQKKMIEKDTIYTVELSKNAALEMIQFYTYKTKNIEKISKLLAKGISDSLSNFVSFRDTCFNDIKFLCEYDPVCNAKREKIYNELSRREQKFFIKYYSRYGLAFFHSLFLNGFSTGMDCVSGNFVIKRFEK